MSDNNNFDAKKLLDIYIHDYLVNKNMNVAAQIFKQEANIGEIDCVMESPDGFLKDWWSIFYDKYSSTMQLQAPESSYSQMNQEQQQLLNLEEIMEFANPFASSSSRQLVNGISNSSYQAQTGEVIEHGIMISPDPVSPNMFLSTGHIDAEQNDVVTPHQRNAVNFEEFEAFSFGTTINSNVGTSQYQHTLMIPGGSSSNQFAHSGQNSLVTPLQANSEFGAFSFGTTPNSTVGPSQYQHMSMIPVGNFTNQVAYSAQNNVVAQVEANPVFAANSFGTQPNPIVEPNQHQQNLMIPGGSSSNLASQTWSMTGHFTGQSSHVGNSSNDRVSTYFVGSSSTYLPSSRNTDEPEAGIPFKEFGSLQPCNTEITCCHFSTDGKILAGSGIRKKIFIWNVENRNWISTGKDQPHIATDIRFKPNSSFFATSCFDKTIQIWDASKPYHYTSILRGHSHPVISLDFHPKSPEILCSSDTGNEIRFWNVRHTTCSQVFKVAANTSVRFQPRSGNYLAVASQNTITIIDVDTNYILQILEGHQKNIRSICWDTSGKYIGSVSEDSARIWSTGSGGKCIYELCSDGNKFESCTFHPSYSMLLVLGGYKTIQLWNPTGFGQTDSILAHNGVIGALADSPENELIASASYDQTVKLWK